MHCAQHLYFTMLVVCRRAYGFGPMGLAPWVWPQKADETRLMCDGTKLDGTFVLVLTVLW